jgi:hypothetical protein
MKHLLFLTIIAILATISSCKKDKKCPDISTILIEQEMKDWIVFQPGSYWIYIDSITGSYDSVYVTSTYYDTLNIRHSDLFRNSDNKCITKSHQEVHVFMRSVYNGSEIKLSGKYGRGSGVSNNVTPVHGSVYIYDQKYSGGDGGLSKYMFFPVLQGTVGAWNGFTIIRHDTLFATFKVFDKTYQNVLLVSDGYNSAVNAITKYYHSKNIGVIRKEIYKFKGFHDKEPLELLHVWELADYKVIQ